MHARKIAFVSSYDESCGIATFTQVLVDSINKIPGWKAECLKLDLLFTQSANRQGQKLGDDHVRQIAAQMKDYDAVNIQCEFGLYGTTPGMIYKRLEMLAKAHPSTSLTMHTLSFTDERERLAKFLMRTASLSLRLKLSDALRDFRDRRAAGRTTKITRKVLEIFMRRDIPIIVHTERSRRYIKHFLGYDDVRAHPLKYLAADFRPDLSAFDKIKSHQGLDATDKTIGIFGFVAPYKGHDDALAALKLLPKNYKLLIFGRQHPRSIRNNAKDPYVAHLLATIEKQKLCGRVFFMGELPHEDFIGMAAGVDVCWMPYYENGQEGSGIASICLDVAPRVLCSTAFVFDELFRLSPYSNVMRFDIGNYRELADKTRLILDRDAPQPPYSTQTYTVESQAALYLETTLRKAR